MIYKEEDYDAEQHARDLRNSIRFVEDPLRDTLAVDLDGCLAEKLPGPFDKDKIGAVIWPEMERVLDAIVMGRKVVIFTARAADPENIPPIRKWLEHQAEAYEYEPLGQLEITNVKSPTFSEMHDDRAKEILPGGVMKSDAEVVKAFVEAQHPRNEHGEWAHVATTNNGTHEVVIERGKFKSDGPETNRLTIRPIGGTGGDVYHLTDAQWPSLYAERLLSAAKVRSESAGHKKEAMTQLGKSEPRVESVTFKRPLRKTRTVLLKISGESDRFLSGRECDVKGYHFGPERTIEKKHITLRKAMPIRYDKKTPSPAPPQMTMPEQLKHLAGTAEDPRPDVVPDEFGRFPSDPTLKELRTPDRSTYEQGVAHDFKEQYLRNDVRDADRRKQDLPSEG